MVQAPHTLAFSYGLQCMSGANYSLCTVYCVVCTLGPKKKKHTAEKAKVVAAVWGTYVLECRTSHLAARMIFREGFGRTSIFYGDGLAWCELDDHPFFWSIHSVKRLFFFFFFTYSQPGPSLINLFVQYSPLRPLCGEAPGRADL